MAKESPAAVLVTGHGHQVTISDDIHHHNQTEDEELHKVFVIDQTAANTLLAILSELQAIRIALEGMSE